MSEGYEPPKLTLAEMLICIMGVAFSLSIGVLLALSIGGVR